MAYTLNNDQPVKSSYIGENPLFYMDYDIECEDDLYNASDIKILERELTALKNEIESYDKFSESFIETGQERHDRFEDLKEELTGFKKGGGGSDISALLAKLKTSRTSDFYLEFAAEKGVTLSYSEQIETSTYDRESAKILINPGRTMPEQVLLAVRELRRHWQHRQGALIEPLLFHPDNAILINRLQEADLSVAMIRTAWELQLADEKDVWQRIENSPLCDIGRAFAREAFSDFRTLNNGTANAAAFESWFLSERCKAQDKDLITTMLSDYNGYVFDLAQAQNAVTPTFICALGEMPFGKNYLAPHVQTLMNDPIFTEVRDRANANFLWFIKFERTYREAEQDLQTHDDLSTERVRSSGQTITEKDSHHGHTTGQVIQLFHGEEPENKNKDTTRKSGKRLSGKPKAAKQTADIVYLRRWSGE